jgi:putative component of toxin-antitoxin plasmid stabilization module
MSNVDRDVELARGQWGVVFGVIRLDGSCPARAFLQGLDVRAQTQFQARFERMTSVGHLVSPDQYRQLQVDGIPVVFEIKVHSGPGWRLYVVPVRRDWIATHGRRKPKDKAVKSEVMKARSIFGEWER